MNRTKGQANNQANPEDGTGLKRLASLAGKQFQGGIVLYDGHTAMQIRREQKLYAVPISKLWER